MDGTAQNQADVRLILGDQGAGKTNTAVAMVVDDVHQNITGITLPSGAKYKAQTLKDDEISMLEKRGIVYNPIKYTKIFNQNNESKIIKIPNGCMINSPIRVFSNFHFYGIPFKYVVVEEIIENINNGMFTNGWIVLDESILTDKRDTMTQVGKMMAWFGAQARRRKLKMVIIAQYADMVQSRFNLFATTRVLCSYDKYTKMIDLDVNDNSEVMGSTTFYAPDYWRYFRHDEIVSVPQYKIDKTLANMYK
jgi:hypothetical protein